MAAVPHEPAVFPGSRDVTAGITQRLHNQGVKSATVLGWLGIASGWPHRPQ